MRNFVKVRFPELSQRLRSIRNLSLRALVVLKHALEKSARNIAYFFRMLSRRSERQAFIADAKPNLQSIRFLQGLQTSHSGRAIWRWHRRHNISTLIAVIGEISKTSGFTDFESQAKRTLDAEIIEVPPEQVARLGARIAQEYPKFDLILVDAQQPLPRVHALLQLKHAAYRYHQSERIGVVTPGHEDSQGMRRNIYADRQSENWKIVYSHAVRDYGQAFVPRFVLGAQAHGAYLKHWAVARFASESSSPSLDTTFNGWLRNLMRAEFRALEYSAASVWSTEPDVNELGSLEWFFRRDTHAHDSALPIVFVLPATSMSGGIRAVLEKAEALIALGAIVEVWSLQGDPDWTEISFQVRKFDSYDSLTDALSLVDALKIATWWETAEPVFLASLQRGIPVQYVQEFESWFYPDSESAQAAVVSSYRPEFAYTTTASYQQAELAEIGIKAPIIPPAYDAELFFADPSVKRDSNTLLALGRTFFQKNFRQTADAWLSLKDARPNLQLFGFEPDVLRDSRASYAVKPSDTEIANLYRTATAFIQTSLHEGFSLPLMEAMACGCPVITTDSHGNRDFCVDEVNCLMVEQGDVEGTARAIQRLMSDAELRTRLSAAGIETAKRYSWDRVARETQEVYRAFAERSAGR